MDPFTALSVSCNVLQLFDIAWKLLSETRTIYSSSDGATLGTRTLEVIAGEVDKLSDSIIARGTFPPGLQELCRLSATVAADLSAILNTLRVKSTQSKWQSFRVALREIRTKRQIEEFTDRLQRLQTQVMANIQFLMM
jgi:hypothetical protein